jgi:hypothetical protein
MRDLLLQAAGLAAIAVAIIHGVLGETKVLARATIQPARLRTLIRLVWQDRRWRALDCRPRDGVRDGATLDSGDVRLRIHVRGSRQRVRHARPAFRVDGPQRRGRAGGRGILASDRPLH